MTTTPVSSKSPQPGIDAAPPVKPVVPTEVLPEARRKYYRQWSTEIDGKYGPNGTNPDPVKYESEIRKFMESLAADLDELAANELEKIIQANKNIGDGRTVATMPMAAVLAILIKAALKSKDKLFVAYGAIKDQLFTTQIKAANEAKRLNIAAGIVQISGGATSIGLSLGTLGLRHVARPKSDAKPGSEEWAIHQRQVDNYNYQTFTWIQIIGQTGDIWRGGTTISQAMAQYTQQEGDALADLMRGEAQPFMDGQGDWASLINMVAGIVL
ncbi:MAG TPA: hypothetical protein VGE55_13205 [Limnobacter sp.]|uniref:hypothetical protein n=1 Tax=Limnobacter sp. TaxID=2003368 RepID=UPI002ED91CA2